MEEEHGTFDVALAEQSHGTFDTGHHFAKAQVLEIIAPCHLQTASEDPAEAATLMTMG
jgi:hypothetical protein